MSSYLINNFHDLLERRILRGIQLVYSCCPYVRNNVSDIIADYALSLFRLQGLQLLHILVGSLFRPLPCD
jgi:hypothetical protein